ncbi:hypothetical protein NM208_g7063 [Fusarium decemcellulare]|uniref:Uncharacterized protein n=1 Tax=Fusarium decemcellulare TaxID=57161 RepID=A0ACC1SAM2_9HYPO|nr:hypothetical protein NM208_g7063 [Fusarium decemcellulare]
MRFRIYLCPATQRDIRNAITKYGYLPALDVLADACCQLVHKIARAPPVVTSTVTPTVPPVSFSDPLPALEEQTPIKIEHVRFGGLLSSSGTARGEARLQASCNLGDETEELDMEIDDQYLEMLAGRLGTHLNLGKL